MTRRGRLVRIARPSSSMERSRFPFGLRARRAMFLRCANGRVCDLLLTILSDLFNRIFGRQHILHEVEDGHSVAHWRQQTCSIWREEQTTSAVDSAQKIRELCACQSVDSGIVQQAYLEISLHLDPLAVCYLPIVIVQLPSDVHRHRDFHKISGTSLAPRFRGCRAAH